MMNLHSHFSPCFSCNLLLNLISFDGKHGQTDPVRTVQIDPFKTVETDPVKTEQTDPPLGLDIKVAFGRFLGNRILLA